MRRRFVPVLVAILALTLAAAAAADGGGPSPGVTVGWDGLLSADGKLRYVAIPGNSETTLVATRTSDGRVAGWTAVAGAFGIPLIGQDGTTAGLSLDGRTLVLGDAVSGQPLRTLSHFVLLDPKKLGLAPRQIVLPGDFTFDALSPSGKRLYFIQHVSKRNLTRYVVRAYDLDQARLLPGRIADRTQKGWVMQGYAMTRATSADGRWAYTLYQNPGGYPFVHALDTMRGVAHCIGVPFTTDQSVLYNMRLALRDGGRSLALHWKSGRPYMAIDTQTWRISHPGSGFPWWIVGAGAGAAMLAAAALLLLIRRVRSRLETEQLREVIA
jgi:hypothetical protein